MSSDSEPRLRVIWTDPVTGRRGYAVIDRMVNGLAGGGTRMRSGVTMQEVERLARTMSYKNGAFNLPGGGAKGGVGMTVQAMLDRSGDPKAAGRRVSQGLAINVEGIGLADCIGGYGVAEAAAAAADFKRWDMANLRAVVQGFGS